MRKRGKKRPGAAKAIGAVIIAAATAAVIGLVMMIQYFQSPGRKYASDFQEKAKLLHEQALADWMNIELGINPAGQAGYAVFFSVCDGTKRARVWSGTGNTPEKAWDAAMKETGKQVNRYALCPKWVKTDLVYISDKVSAEELEEALKASRLCYLRYGISFDEDFKEALLEEELNGAGIYDYDKGNLNLEQLNKYLEHTGKRKIEDLPTQYTAFRCFGWICDEENQVYELSGDRESLGRRTEEQAWDLENDLTDQDYIKIILKNTAGFLMKQVREDGSIVCSMDPRFGYETGSYNMTSHGNALLAMIQYYRLEPDEKLAETIDQAAAYIAGQVYYDQEGRAFLPDSGQKEEGLEECGPALSALIEYMQVFENQSYDDMCSALGEGILFMINEQSAEISRGEGQAARGLLRLYGRTRKEKWLKAGQRMVDSIMEQGDTACEEWQTACAINELIRYVPDSPEYYVFVLERVQNRLLELSEEAAPCPENLELLMTAFEIYHQMKENGGKASGFDLQGLLRAIGTRAERQLNGYFYPEYAMYMDSPEAVLGSFMIRENGFLVDLDNLADNLNGYCLYCRNYRNMTDYRSLDEQ